MPQPVILVVEDELLLCEMVADELEEAGYRVITAMTGEEAKGYLESEERIDLLFTDIRLPGVIDGWQLAEVARSLRPDLPIIYASGYSVRQPRPAAGSFFLRKPYLPTTVIRTIETFGLEGQPN